MTVNAYTDDKVTSQTCGEGEYTITYDPDNNKAGVTDRKGFYTEIEYNSMGNPIRESIENPNLSYTTRYEYNSNMDRTKIIFPKGNCIDFTYDYSGNLTGIYRKKSSSDGNPISTIFTYYVYDFVQTITDPKGNTTTFTYDWGWGAPNLAKITYPTVLTPDGDKTPVRSFTYNSFGRIDTATISDGMVTKYEYYNDANDANNYGRPWKIIVDYNDTDGLNLTTEYTYDLLGRAIEVKDPNGNIRKSKYNELGQLTKAIAPSPFEYVTNFSYDKNGNRSKDEREISGEPNQITSFTYKMNGKMRTITDPLGNVTTYGYNKSEEPNLVTDAEIHSEVAGYNERGLLCKVIDANGGITELSYDDNSNLMEIKDANGNTTTYDYDGFDRLICITYPDDTNEVFGYDKNSNITSRKNRKGETIYYGYDAMNRLVVKNRPGDPNITYLYSITGRVVDVNDGNVTTYSYDRIRRITDVNDIDSRTVKYEYDERGLRTKLVYPDNSFITYEYDAMSRLTKVKMSGTSVLAEYEYDELSRRTLLTLLNDANAVYEYDIGNQLKKLTNNLNGGNSIVFDYNDYDKVGNRLSMKVDDANAHVYTYDSLYQLTDVNYNNGINNISYFYDKLGNRTSVDNGGTTNYAHNRLNQYASVGGTNYSYDENGNLTNDGTYKYYYDCDNRLTDVNDQNGDPVATYKYDYKGRRISKTAGGTTTKYCYDGDEVIAEYEGGTLVRKYIYGPYIDEPICMIVLGVGSYYYHFDGLGSIAALSNSSGNVVERYSYDVFGEPNTTSNVGNPYMFTGRRYEPDSGLYYNRARYYSSQIGRFLQTDPIGYVNSMNLYNYVGNNIVNKRDPLGLYWMPAPGTRPWAPDIGSSCCKKHGPSIAEMLGKSVLECAWIVMGETWSPKLLPFGVGGGAISIIKQTPSLGIGLGIGTGLQYLVALAFCDYRECEEYGTIDSCGKCK